MTWLKKFGEEVLKGINFVFGIGVKVAPVIAGLDPVLAPELDLFTMIAKLVQNAETQFGQLATQELVPEKNGALKMASLLPLVNQGVQGWIANKLPGSGKVQDKTKFDTGVNEVTQGIVDILNSLAPEVQTKQLV